MFMKSLRAWHGSLDEEIQELRPTTHFGSKLQAYCAIAAHAALDGHDGKPSIYECSLRFCDEELLHLSDWGSPNPAALLLAYCTAIGDRQRYSLNYQRMGRDLTPDAPNWIEWLREATKCRGHKLFSYSNKVEANGLSYCVIDSGIVTINSVEPCSYDSIARSLSALQDGGHGFTSDEWTCITKFLSAQKV